MSEVEIEQPEIEEIDHGVVTDPVVGTVTADDVDLTKNDINDFIDAIQSKNFTKANSQFDTMVNDRLQTTLDQAKAKIAGQIYNGEEEESDDTSVEN